MSNWFVALPVEIGEVLSRLPSPPGGIRLLAAEDLHLTVAFLGRIGERRARAAFDVWPREAVGPFQIELGPIVAMGDPRRPGALSALVEGVDAENRPIAEVLTVPRDALLEAADLPLEKRAMRPHVTLARLRRKASDQERQRALAWAAGCDLGSTRSKLDRVALYTAAQPRNTRAYDRVETRSLVTRSTVTP